MIGFGNDELADAPPLRAGEAILCPRCYDVHKVEDSDPPVLLVYRCGDDLYLAGVDGKNVMARFMRGGEGA